MYSFGSCGHGVQLTGAPIGALEVVGLVTGDSLVFASCFLPAVHPVSARATTRTATRGVRLSVIATSVLIQIVGVRTIPPSPPSAGLGIGRVNCRWGARQWAHGPPCHAAGCPDAGQADRGYSARPALRAQVGRV